MDSGIRPSSGVRSSTQRFLTRELRAAVPALAASKRSDEVSYVGSDTLTGFATEVAALVDRLQRVNPVPASDDELLGFWRSMEIQTRRLAAVDHQHAAVITAR